MIDKDEIDIVLNYFKILDILIISREFCEWNQEIENIFKIKHRIIQ